MFLVDHSDEKWMAEALKEASKAAKSGEVPVGAVLVFENRVISRGYNQVETLQDATAHAEILCITAGESHLNNWRLTGCTLYTTLEPCSMCAGAILLSRISRVVWGAPDIRHGANGSWVDLFKLPHPTHSLTICRGVLEKECAFILRDFFRQRRRENNFSEC